MKHLNQICEYNNHFPCEIRIYGLSYVYLFVIWQHVRSNIAEWPANKARLWPNITNQVLKVVVICNSSSKLFVFCSSPLFSFIRLCHSKFLTEFIIRKIVTFTQSHKGERMVSDVKEATLHYQIYVFVVWITFG